MYELRAGCRIVSPSELPVIPKEIFAITKEVRAQTHSLVCLPDERARKYVDKIPAAETGNSGSRQTIIARLKILSLTDGDMEKAWTLLLYYNQRCVPTWDTEAEDGPDSLKRKLREAQQFWRARNER